jgi:hypothetical protein
MERVLTNINRNNRNTLFLKMLQRLAQKLAVVVDLLLVDDRNRS